MLVSWKAAPRSHARARAGTFDAPMTSVIITLTVGATRTQYSISSSTVSSRVPLADVALEALEQRLKHRLRNFPGPRGAQQPTIHRVVARDATVRPVQPPVQDAQRARRVSELINKAASLQKE